MCQLSAPCAPRAFGAAPAQSGELHFSALLCEPSHEMHVRAWQSVASAIDAAAFHVQSRKTVVCWRSLIKLRFHHISIHENITFTRGKIPQRTS